MVSHLEGTIDKAEDRDALSRFIGMFYILVGAAGMIVLSFSGRPAGYEIFSEALVVIAITILLLVLIAIGIFMAVSKPDPKTTLVP